MALTIEQRQALEKEWAELQEKLNADFPSPKDLRRNDEVTSLLMTDGESSDIQFRFLRRKKSERVTSFTKDRR